MNIIHQEFNDVLTGVVYEFLYREHIDNIYKACKTMKSAIDEDWKIIYRDCLHQQPHSEYDEPIVDDYGNQEWYKEGKLHRDGDLPAIEVDYSQYWYKEGKCHRDGDMPAVIMDSGTQRWYKEGKLHRDGNNPAVIMVDGYQAWYKEGKYIEQETDLLRHL